MNIGIFTSSLDRQKLTGPGIYLHYMLDNLLELPDATKYIALIHYQSYENPIYRRVREVIVPRLPGLTEAVLSRKDFDILHYNSLPTWRPFFLLSAKKVLTLHGLGALFMPRLASQFALIELKYLWPLLAKRVDQIITVSEFTRQAAIQHWGVPPERICAIHSGVSEHFQPQSRQAASLLKEKIGRPYLLHVSNYLSVKNVETLVKAFAKLKQQKYSHRLVIIGGRWESSPIPALISDLQLTEDVIFEGYVGNAELPAWYSGADVFVTLSMHESFCFPVVEAMACGCPVVTSNRAAFPEIVGDAGLLVDEPDLPAKAAAVLAKVLDDRVLADRLRERGLKRSRRFNWRENAQKTWKVYQSLL